MSIVDDFAQAWADTRRLTYAFIDAVPDDQWSVSPHVRFGALNKQVRHLVCVQGVYQHGLKERVIDFSTKHSHYKGTLDKTALGDALRRKDNELSQILDVYRRDGADAFEVDFFGRRMRFSRYGAVMIQHEAIHHGQWSLYAALAGFETPLDWRMNWGL